MNVLVVESDAARARSAIARARAAGHRAFVAPRVADVCVALDSVPPPAALLVGPRAPTEATTLAAEAGLPVLLLDDGTGVPAALVAVGLAGCILECATAEELSAQLERAVDRARRLAEADRDGATLEQAGAAILLADAAGIVRRANAAYARVAGGAPRDPEGTDLREILIPDGSESAVAGFADATRGGAPWNGDAMLVAGGARVACRVALSPRCDEAGETSGVVAVLLDLAEHSAREESLREANRLLERRAWLDPLTGLYHRGYLVEVLDRELARARRYDVALAVLMLDLDDFTSVNDLLGHVGADEVLRAVAGVLREGLREGDVLARYGGDEFCAILPNTDAAAAFQVAERVRTGVRGIHYGHRGTQTLGVSVGIATRLNVAVTDGGDRLLAAADRALYVAKDAGGNCVVDVAYCGPQGRLPVPRPRGARPGSKRAQGPRERHGLEDRGSA